MLNRKHTIYMSVALVLAIICLWLPVATVHIVDEKWSGFLVMTNLTMTNSEGGLDLSVWPMFVVLLLTCPITIIAIFIYKKRMLRTVVCRQYCAHSVVDGIMHFLCLYLSNKR